MYKRMIGVYCFIVFLMTVAIFRIYTINASDYLAAAANVQSSYTLEIARTRAGLYDRNLRPLVNSEYRYVASVMPTPQAATELQKAVDEEEWPAVLERLTGGLPFALEVADNDIYAVGVDVFRVPLRYEENQLAAHLVGYLGDEGRTGVAGLERAYDELLARMGGRITVRYRMDAAGQPMQGGGTVVERENEQAPGGVVLTLDRDMQQIAENALVNGCDKGAVVVLDVASGDILAMASTPSYDPNNIAASLESADAPFINRAISGYNIGSVFKLAVSAAALESGESRYREYECQGLIDINGQVFRCNNHAVHGVLDMQKALQVSCNTYFIDLALDMDPQYLLGMCERLGYNTQLELAPELYTAAGNLPTVGDLSVQAALANFSFGQGSSLASPLQVAQMVATLAGDGVAVTPRLVQGVTEDGTRIDEPVSRYAGGKVISTRTAQALQEMMIGVIEEGSGRTGQPLSGGAGGKTSSAQTGQYYENDPEHEIVHAWFAGFYPAENPRYSVVVFVEGGESGEQVAAPIFKQVVDGLAGLSVG